MKIERKEIILVEMDSRDFDSLMVFIKKCRDRTTLDNVSVDVAGRLYKDLLEANSISDK